MECNAVKSVNSLEGDEDDAFMNFEGDKTSFWADDADDQRV